MSNPLSELLDAIERHTQAVQANTAAVNSFLNALEEPHSAAAVAETRQRLKAQLGEQLREAGRIVARIEQLREQLLTAPESLEP